ncbi:MAG: hypothetical protein AB7O97_20645 [Planctomycetota bacterium]
MTRARSENGGPPLHGPRLRRCTLAFALACALGGCGGGNDDRDDAAEQSALLDELRSLRAALAPPVDQRSLDRALLPLQESIQALGREQGGLQQRQQALSDELSRWTMYFALTGRAGAPPVPWQWPMPGSPDARQPGFSPTSPGTQAQPTDPGLMARLDQLEALLRGQSQRQQDLEAVVTRSLDATSQHVEALLGDLQQMRLAATAPATGAPTAQPNARPDAPPAGTAPDGSRAADAALTGGTRPAASRPTPGATADTDADADADADAARLADDAAQREAAFLGERARLHQEWLIAVLAVGLLAIVFLGWRLLRQPARPRQPDPEPDPQSPGDMSTDELWAAAGLLSEAVGRLRGAVPADAAIEPAVATPADDVAAPAPDVVDVVPPQAGGTPVASSASRPPAAASPQPDADDELFVLDDEQSLLAEVDWSQLPVQRPGGSAAPGPATPAPAPADAQRHERAATDSGVGGNGAANGHTADTDPLRWTLQLDTDDHVMARATIDAYLKSDPRVLRRPAPVVRPNAAGLCVECVLLPGLLPGEREHLRATLQRLMGQL